VFRRKKKERGLNGMETYQKKGRGNLGSEPEEIWGEVVRKGATLNGTAGRKKFAQPGHFSSSRISTGLAS